MPGSLRRVVVPDAIAPPFFLAAGLLLVAGAVKTVRPNATAQALLDADLPGSRRIARAIGGVEILVGTWSFAAPAAGGALALAAVYLTFAAFLAFLLVRHPDAGSCGCAGAAAVPPSRLHLTLDALAAAVALAWVGAGAESFVVWSRGLGWVVVPTLAGLALAGWLAVIVVTEAPIAYRAWTRPVHDHEKEPHGHDHARADAELASAGIGPGHPSLWPGVRRSEEPA